MATLKLKRGHVQAVWAGHPWVYAQAVERLQGAAEPGDVVELIDPHGNFLGRGFYSPSSAIVLRILSRNPEETLDDVWVRSKLAGALAARGELGLPNEGTTGYRLVHAEGDGLAGLIVDRLGDALVVQFLTVGMKRRQAMALDALTDLVAPRSISDRTPTHVMQLEGFTSERALLCGEIGPAFEFKERGLAFSIPVEIGQKTGYYFDQRMLRERIEALAPGQKVLDACTFVGSFALGVARGGAKFVLAVDESPAALRVGQEHAERNGVSDRIEFRRGDARKVLSDEANRHAFDRVIVDPPRLAPTRANRDKALGAYERWAQAGCLATRKGGLLAFCSCSSAIDLYALTRALALGARRAGCEAIVLERHFQGPDHPVPAAFGEGLYLKALIARIIPGGRAEVMLATA